MNTLLGAERGDNLLDLTIETNVLKRLDVKACESRSLQIMCSGGLGPQVLKAGTWIVGGARPLGEGYLQPPRNGAWIGDVISSPSES